MKTITRRLFTAPLDLVQRLGEGNGLDDDFQTAGTALSSSFHSARHLPMLTQHDWKLKDDGALVPLPYFSSSSTRHFSNSRMFQQSSPNAQFCHDASDSCPRRGETRAPIADHGTKERAKRQASATHPHRRSSVFAARRRHIHLPHPARLQWIGIVPKSPFSADLPPAMLSRLRNIS
jgi:hypothetical protein